MNHEKERIKILVVYSLSHVENRLTVLRQYYYSIVITATVLRAPILKKPVLSARRREMIEMVERGKKRRIEKIGRKGRKW